MSIVFAVVLIGSILIISFGISQYQSLQYQIVNYEDARDMADLLRANLQMEIENTEAWSKTLTAAGNATAMACLTDSSINCCDACAVIGDLNSACATPKTSRISVLNSQGQLVFPNTDTQSTAGFSINGYNCNSFDGSTGDNNCPYQVRVTWKALCNNCGCLNPQTIINTEVIYNPQNLKVQLNTNRLNKNNFILGASTGVPEIDGLLVCHSQLRFYAPLHVNADSEGCVNGDILTFY